MLHELSNLFNHTISVFSTYDFLGDTLDILFLTVLVYFLLKLFKDSRAWNLAKGLIVLVVAYVLVNILHMEAASFLFRKVFEYILVILAIIFAPELRKALETLGNARTWSSLRSVFKLNSKQKEEQAYNEALGVCINSVCKAAADMSSKRIGALMVFEKDTPLGEIIDTGTKTEARITSSMLGNIFYPGAPLHDGAAIIRNNRLVAAGCILPLTSRNEDVSKKLGTRHRAAIGMSEQSDAIILVVSEETGGISIAKAGRLYQDLADGDIRSMLYDELRIGGDKNGK